ncbi:MAG: carboxy terminal-processing peptidase [Desulfotignum sp.]|nr:carboxy terminal-processing peptidase [Desulfotignum sp.]
MRNNLFHKSAHLPAIWHILSLGLAISVFVFCTTAFSRQAVLAPEKNHMVQCVRIVAALERDHYLGKQLDKTLSTQIFDRYITLLDPSRHLFTQKDMDQLHASRFRFEKDLKKGNLTFAYDVYNLYYLRATQRLEYIQDAIKTWEELDLHTQDSLVIDNKNRSWQQSFEDLQGLWEKELINHIITLQLDDQTPADITDTLVKIYDSRLARLSQTNSNDVFQLFMNSVTESFDPHTQYFPPRVSEDFDIHMSLSLEGIGAVLQTEYEYTKVLRLIPKGPADKSNLLMPGDKIIGVGQGKNGEIKDTIGQRIDEVVKLIRGPKNTYVRLKIIPAKKTGATATISIRRDKVKLEEQSAQKKVITLSSQNRDVRIGIIEIPNFYIDFTAYHRGDKDYKSTTNDVKKLLFELKKENIDGLIVDLRDNGGGSLKEANDLTGLFLTSGPTVQIRTKNQVTQLYDEDPSIQYTGPLLVLINRMSASASEIFAGAIKDYHRGLVVGTRSFGKGTVQELKPLGDGKLKLTSAKFYRVSGESTQHRGVIPDISLPRIYNLEDTGESSLEGALLWDVISRVRYQAYPPLDPLHDTLLRQYQQRITQDPGMVYLNRQLELTNRLGNETDLSLNIDRRRQKRVLQEQAALEIENEYLTASGKEPIDTLAEQDARINGFKEILLKQAQRIMTDFIALSKQQGYAW